ncbi:4-hydroxybenzoate octaprenyltransferase [Labrys miyagiensis]|uniref:4-hydroxybenzoate octaprenyltransferase n=1 Tax=Labrys miyagiensis TaxID=346912 RepID=A0ABQ6CQX6_9HYPH|nr:4-hydroxybenzoate octaprenyltransferase [Labrys miyagiensis]GLS22535.1 4-hydroxybenzoate octaprenyltransferase [Labrys miyagiensis]
MAPLSAQAGTPDKVADAPAGNWVDRHAPAFLRPFLRLSRADRPIGGWLLMWPCWWSAALVALHHGAASQALWHLFLFLVGAFVMRGAGCTLNDIVDRDIDGQVERTRLRPIPSGQVSTKAAVAWLGLQGLVGLVVLLQFNAFAIGLGIASLAVVAVYPFMKRITSWPQAVLGLAFSWGALMGWATVTASLALPAVLLFIGSVLWVIAYDTIYACQDKEDDAIVGVRSTALLFGERVRPAVGAFYAGCVVLIALALALNDASPLSFLGLAGFAIHLAWQVMRFDHRDGALCLEVFRSNRNAGAILFAGLVADCLWQWAF